MNVLMCVFILGDAILVYRGEEVLRIVLEATVVDEEG